MKIKISPKEREKRKSYYLINTVSVNESVDPVRRVSSEAKISLTHSIKV